MKAKKQKGFWKCEHSLIDRFKDHHELLLYVQLRCLAGPDREGRIPMDTAALAARIKWKEEHLAPVLARLMDPDPKSRCQLADGRTVAFIDQNRPELGYWIPGVRRHRKKNSDNERRLAQKAEWLRKNRRSRAKDPANPQRGTSKLRKSREVSGSPGEVKGSLPLPSKEVLGKSKEVSGSPKEDCDVRREKGEDLNSKTSGKYVAPPRDPSELSIEEAKAAIKHDLFDNDLPEKNWSALALQNLIAILPGLTKDEIFTVGWWWTYESNPKMPELAQRPAYGLAKILEHWDELYTRAKTWDQRHFPSSIKYPDPLA